jgi:hypothetical protein
MPVRSPRTWYVLTEVANQVVALATTNSPAVEQLLNFVMLNRR